MRTAQRLAVGLGVSPLLLGCGGAQSALDPAGRGAEQIAVLFWWLAGGAAVVWLAVAALAVYSLRARLEAHQHRRAALLIIGGGAVGPALLLAVMLGFGLAMLPGLVAPAPEGSRRIAVAGEQWWWRVQYELPGGRSVELANEVRLPVGEPVDFLLASDNVIHSFWVPALGGKVDMIPGRSTRLSLLPTKSGRYRGVCAEFCGTSHALMAFPVVVMEAAGFERWLAHQARPAASPATALAARGEGLFLASGCHACHTVRGTAAAGTIGPDLTHVGGRLSVGAGTLPSSAAGFQRWIADPEGVKPGVHMPSFGMLPAGEVAAIAAYLEGLE